MSSANRGECVTTGGLYRPGDLTSGLSQPGGEKLLSGLAEQTSL